MRRALVAVRRIAAALLEIHRLRQARRHLDRVADRLRVQNDVWAIAHINDPDPAARGLAEIILTTRRGLR